MFGVCSSSPWDVIGCTSLHRRTSDDLKHREKKKRKESHREKKKRKEIFALTDVTRRCVTVRLSRDRDSVQIANTLQRDNLKTKLLAFMRDHCPMLGSWVFEFRIEFYLSGIWKEFVKLRGYRGEKKQCIICFNCSNCGTPSETNYECNIGLSFHKS